jgi:hypothetical protein
MPFTITDYRVQAMGIRTDDPAIEIRHVLLLSGQSVQGQVTLGSIAFFATRTSIHPGVLLSNQVVGFLPDIEFASWYDILRSERPVSIHWTLLPDSTTQLLDLVLFTGAEPPGEGPVDFSAVLREQEAVGAR